MTRRVDTGAGFHQQTHALEATTGVWSHHRLKAAQLAGHVERRDAQRRDAVHSRRVERDQRQQHFEAFDATQLARDVQGVVIARAQFNARVAGKQLNAFPVVAADGEVKRGLTFRGQYVDVLDMQQHSLHQMRVPAAGCDMEEA